MLIIWGFRVRGSRLSEGSFFCPKCGADRSYVLQQIRRWFTLFFIPLIPLKVLGQSVKCQTCGTAFRPEVLNTPTSAALSDHLRAALRVAAIAVLRAGDPTEPRARAAAVRAVRGTDETYTEAMLAGDIDHADTSQLVAYIGPLAAGLQGTGKEALVAHLTRIAAADGIITAAERAVLENVAAPLGLSAAHLTGIVSMVEQEAASPQGGTSADG